jgi:hypothetical protein
VSSALNCKLKIINESSCNKKAKTSKLVQINSWKKKKASRVSRCLFISWFTRRTSHNLPHPLCCPGKKNHAATNAPPPPAEEGAFQLILSRVLPYCLLYRLQSLETVGWGGGWLLSTTSVFFSRRSILDKQTLRYGILASFSSVRGSSGEPRTSLHRHRINQLANREQAAKVNSLALVVK